MRICDRLNPYLTRIAGVLMIGGLCAAGQNPDEANGNPVAKSCIKCMDDLLAQPQQPVKRYCWVKKTPCPRDAELVLREVRSDKEPGRSHLSLVWVTVPLSAIKISVTNDELGRISPQQRDLIVTSGGFASCTNCSEAKPVGLVIENGSRSEDLEGWHGQGGIIVQRSCSGKSCAWPSPEIVKTSDYKSSKDINAALQCKPLVIEKGAIAVFDQPKDRFWNRLAVAVHDTDKPTGTLVVATITADKAEAVTQYEFAYLLSKLRTIGTQIDTALQLDGAYGPAVTIPSLGLTIPSSGGAANVTRLHVMPKSR